MNGCAFSPSDCAYTRCPRRRCHSLGETPRWRHRPQDWTLAAAASTPRRTTAYATTTHRGECVRERIWVGTNYLGYIRSARLASRVCVRTHIFFDNFFIYFFFYPFMSFLCCTFVVITIIILICVIYLVVVPEIIYRHMRMYTVRIEHIIYCYLLCMVYITLVLYIYIGFSKTHIIVLLCVSQKYEFSKNIVRIHFFFTI